MKASLQPTAVIASALEEVTMYFKLHGGAIPTNRPVVASVLQPIPLNNTSVPGDMRIEVTKADASAAKQFAKCEEEHARRYIYMRVAEAESA